MFDLALEGHANKQIAYRLGMSEGTVKTHLAAVMRAYEVNNRVQLLRKVELGKVEPGRVEPGRVEPGRVELGRVASAKLKPDR